MKFMQYPPVGKLHSFPIPEIQWDTLNVDFIIELSESSKYNIVMIVVDLVSKRAYFILIHKTVTVEKAARLFFHHIWKLHRLPRWVVLDRGPQFIALFTWELYRLLGIRLVFSTAWHFQINRQMECINQELDCYKLHLDHNSRNTWLILII